MTTISKRLQAVKTGIHHAGLEFGRHPDSIAMLAVSKAQSADRIREAYSAGQRAFGENYLQEALDKQLQLADLDIEWHYIGPIQSNKTQAIAQHFSWVHSIDRIKIVERLSAARSTDLPPLQVCIQVNVSGEASKSGVEPSDVLPLAEAIIRLPQLRLRGLMAIPAPTQDMTVQRKQFGLVRETLVALKDQLQKSGHKQQAAGLDTLSMGMSDDYPAALAEGSTMVRIGSAIFGARPIKNKE